MACWRSVGVFVIGLALLATATHGQALSRMATTVHAVTRYPVFFHDKALALVGTTVPVAGGALNGFPVEAPRTFVIAPRSGEPPSRVSEFRGRLFDVGRFLSDDSRLGPLNLPPIISSVMGDRWPAREQLFVLTGATWSDPPAANDISVRAIALAPAAFEGRTVTLRGRFRGRNLLGDLPAWPRLSEWDFVLQSADAAIWVLGRRPRGSGFDLSPTSRAQTGRWLEVTGRIEIREDLPVLIADSIRTTQAEQDVMDEPEPPTPALPPPTVVFTAPAAGEVLVARDAVVRVQFSRPMRESTFADHIRVTYSESTMAMPPWTVTYRPGPMAIEIRFAYALAGGVEVRVEFLDGIVSADGGALPASTLRFTTAGG